jgi:hypothetical protein
MISMVFLFVRFEASTLSLEDEGAVFFGVSFWVKESNSSLSLSRFLSESLNDSDFLEEPP